MKKQVIFLLAAAMGFTACKQYKKGPGDLQYKVHKSGSGETLKEGDFVKLNAVEKTEGDSVKMSTYDMERPFYFPIGKTMFPGDITDAVKQLHEGDSATFKINLDSVAKYTGQPKQAGVKDKYTVYTVKVEKVLRKGANEPDSVADRKRREFYEKEYKALVAANKASEPVKIKKYIDDNNLKTQTSASGLQYVIQAPGSGAKAAAGDTVMVNYVGKFPMKRQDGKYNIFDTNIEKVAKENNNYTPMKQYGPVPMLIGQTIPGFDEGMKLLAKGGKAVLVIPSKLGYGENGFQSINPFSPLVFEIEVIDIKKPKAGAPVAAAPVKR
ncbi:peptidylprolyl isomerase [Pedobacter yulinensis]|uniref:peptidylprolyl isomerase n=1 Tax=Pedobacter yulinensis TaxID=2126353 RepID=A0A2T3HP27_9SPHI|nr:FKBP-type peptidyl-prolyl cis-trans isomerase [Pedobacter yulinensis]PST84208.1 peptidylprolyl isomerase [Pedobacter yulinensis]